MPFGEILGVGLGAIGGIMDIAGGRKTEKKAAKDMQPWLDRLSQSYDLGMDLFMGGLDDTSYREQLLFDYAFRDKARGEDLADMYRRFVEEDRGQLRNERGYDIQRQSLLDSMSALQRNFEISQLSRANDVARSERDFAVSDYERARRQAESERQWEIDQLNYNRNLASQERDSDLQMLQRAQQMSQQERDYQMGQQQDILSLVSQLSNELEQARAKVGEYIPAQMFTMEDVEKEAARRSQSYQAQVDRAADRVASINEADLIRRGVDSSTIADDKRAEITARLAEEYQKAYDRSFDEAMQYITGAQGMENQNYAQRNTERSNLLNEVMQMYQPGINTRMQLPDLVSAIGPMMPARSGIVNGNVNSANVGPNMNIGTGFVGGNISSGVGPNMQPRSATGFQSVGNYNYNLNLPGSTRFNAGADLITKAPETALGVYENRWNAGREQQKSGAGGLGGAIAGIGKAFGF